MGNKIVQLFLFLLLVALNSADTDNNAEIEETFKLLKQGDEKIELAQQHKDLILLLGNTGSGKSTFVQWIAGDNNKLISREVGKNTAEFIIEDVGNGRIGSSLKSKTIFPELVIDKNNSAAYYDCPGFSDTRSTSYDIASAYFVKKIADHVSSVKIVLVVSHFSVRKGLDRSDFVQLLKHTTDLIKDVEKFRSSFALAVTKVENSFRMEGDNFMLVPDKSVISSIASFLSDDVIPYLEDKHKKSNASNKETLFFESAIKVTKILLQNDHSRIVIFRRPVKSGPLSNITLLQKGKTHVHHLFQKVLKFTEKNSTDFGYTISEASKNYVGSFVTKINEKVVSEVSEINEKIKIHYSSSLEKIYATINSFVENERTVNISEAKALKFELDRERQIFSILFKESKEKTNINDLLSTTNNSLILLGVSNCTINTNKISVQGKYFDFVQAVSDDILNVEPWWKLFEKTEIFFFNSKEFLVKDVHSWAEIISNRLWSEFTKINEKVKNHHKGLINEIHSKIEAFHKNGVCLNDADSKAFAERLQSERRIISEIISKLKNIIDVVDLSNKPGPSIMALGIEDCLVNLRNISLQCQYLNYLEATIDSKLTISQPWWSLFEDTESDFFDSKKNLEKNIFQSAEKTYRNISFYAESIGRFIDSHYENKIPNVDIEQIPEELTGGFHLMSNWTQEAGSLRNIKGFVEKISDLVIKLNLETPCNCKLKNDMLRISHNGKYLESLKILTNGELNTWSVEWIQPFEQVAKYLSESATWYKFLNQLYVKFSEYEIQRDKNKYNVININDWGYADKPQGIEIDKNNIKQFLGKIDKHFLNEYSGIKTPEVTASQLKSLNQVLDLTLKKSISTQCPESGKWIIKGDYIKFSDFVSDNGKIIDLCKNNRDNFNSLNIFSLNTIFIDRNLREVGTKLNINIIAPKWYILGGHYYYYYYKIREINLNGAPGSSHEPTQANTGSHYSGRGDDGLPGLPGGAAGNFLGIGQVFFYGQGLKISTNGGEGGPGQTGGDGGIGGKGQDAVFHDNVNEMTFLRADKESSFLVVKFKKQYRIHGKAGSVGGSGGNGGIGGFGGMRGETKLLNVGVYSESPSVSNTPGSTGIAGKGGAGGEGGMGGHDLMVTWCVADSIITRQERWCDDHTPETWPSFLGRAASGLNGKSGFSTKGRKPPEDANAPQSIADVVSNYKCYVRENLNNLRKRALKDFMKNLDDNKEIKGSFDTWQLVNEFRSLENQLLSLRQNIDVLPFYESLLNLTSEYSKHPNSNENSNSHKKVLAYLYSATLSRIYNLKSASEGNLIIDMDRYLNLAKQNINALSNLKETNNKVKILNQYKESYKSNIGRKIKEAIDFIESQVAPEIDNNLKKVEDKILILISETIDLQTKVRAEEQLLIQKKRELENAFNLSWLLSGFKLLGQIIGCFGSLGSEVDSIMGLTGQITTSLSFNDPDSIKLLNLPEGVLSSIQSLQEKIGDLKDKKVARFKKVLDDISPEVNKHPEVLSRTAEKVKHLLARCESAQNSADFKGVRELEEDLKEEFARKGSELSSSADKSSAFVIKNVNRAMQFGSFGVDIYSKYKNDNQKLEAIDEAIEKTKAKRQQLDLYEKHIYEKIIPTLRTMGEGINNVARNLRDKSQVSLDVTRWQVQNILRDIKLQMQQFTKGFSVEYNLARFIEKMDETITSLINIYDRIQNYQDQQQLAVYIADISSPIVNDINVVNQTLSKAINELDIVIRSNLILEQCKTAINAFTQQIFPFAYRYLDQFRLPDHFLLEGDFEHRAHKAMELVENLQSQLTEHKAAIKNTDAHIGNGWFNRNYEVTRPFFTWENRKCQDAILNLLSGEKVALKADILNGVLDKDAIKFNLIDFNFYSDNSTITEEITKKLKGFTVSATHLGNSYYMYSGKIYIITSDSQNIRFSFERGHLGEPVLKNRVYDKLKSGDIMLSPYTMWEIQLINIANQISFQDLRMYKDKVDLDLVGYGSYLTKGTNVSNLDIENYYKVANIMPPCVGSNDDDD